jgi:uncharacterized protein YndB with AHSA1/START domain
MESNLIAKASVTIAASTAKVWHALTTPASIKQYMFGTEVASDWREGSPITWKGTWEGKPYEDKGVILQLKPERTLQYSHFSPASGLPDKPENYHTVTIELWSEGDATRVALSQDRNPTSAARDHAEGNWARMLQGLKKVLETK